MASPSRPEMSHNFHFEFDPVNKILLARFGGRLTDKSLAELYGAIREYSTATDARATIMNFSSETVWAVSSQFIRELAHKEPAVMDLTRPRFIVSPVTDGYGVSRMFQNVGRLTRPRLQVVRTMDEAFAALGVQSPHFEPLE
jgi:hypothetical protein